MGGQGACRPKDAGDAYRELGAQHALDPEGHERDEQGEVMKKNTRTVVQVRLTARDKKRVEAVAEEERVSVSKFARRLIRAGLDAVTPRDALDGSHSERDRP